MNLTMDLADLNVAEVGDWPGAAKALCFVGLAAAVLAFGYLIIVADKRAELARGEQREAELRGEFADRREAAAGLAVLRAGLARANAAMAEMLGRLPVDTEVPGLVEDITRAAIDNDLTIDRIDLADEREADFHRELPIVVGVTGDYHDLGAFAGDIAGLSRLVTLHDFDLAPRSGPRNLGLTIEARTYRYVPDAPHPPLSGGVALDSATLPSRQ